MGNALAVAASGEAAIEELKKRCERIAASGLVPDHFAKNPRSIAVAIDMARALGEDPILLMQSIHFVSGKPGFAAQYMLGRLRKSGAIRGTVRYDIEGQGETLSVRAKATDAETGEEVVGPPASMEMAKAEGWTKNPKYKSMPEGMLRKRAVTFLVRDHYPDVLAGFHVVDELEDVRVSRAPIRIESSAVADINAALSAPIDIEPATEEVSQ